MLFTSTKDLLIYIKQLMVADNVSIQEIANILGKSHSAVGGALKRDNITLTTLYEICQALGYDLEINLIKKDAETEQTTYNIAMAAREQQPLAMNKQQMESFAKSADEAPNSSQNHDMF